MAWWHRLFVWGAKRPSEWYRVPIRLFSRDGKRSVELRQYRNGQVFFVDQIWVEGTTFKDRDEGAQIGPFESLAAAETAAVNRPWFGATDSST